MGPEKVVVAQAAIVPTERTCYYYLWQRKMRSLAGGYPTVGLPMGGPLSVSDVLSYEQLVLLDGFPFVTRELAVVVLVVVVDNPSRYLIQ